MRADDLGPGRGNIKDKHARVMTVMRLTGHMKLLCGGGFGSASG